VTTRKWAGRLAYALRTLLDKPVPIIFWDERLSSYAADEILAETGMQVDQDAAAAAVILQSYLDARREQRLRDYGRIDLPQKPA
jgi:putative Holliday junction resolvase